MDDWLLGVEAWPTGAEYGGNWLPIRIYLSEAEASLEVESALTELAEEFGIDYAYEFPGQIGSWWREIIAHMQESGSQSQQLAKMERAVDMGLLLVKQAQVDAAQSDAVSKLIVALGNTSEAIVQVGSVLLVKADGRVLVRNLTQRELAFYERNPALFREPVKAMAHLQQAISADAELGEELDRLSGVNFNSRPVNNRYAADEPRA